MLDFAVRLTRAAYRTTPGDLGRLRGVGFDDVGVLQITLIASWFNYVNRVADALGLSRSPETENRRATDGFPSQRQEKSRNV